MEAFLRRHTSDATFEGFDPALRSACQFEIFSGHHAPGLQQPERFAEELRRLLRTL